MRRVAELTGLLDLSSWPPGMHVIVRKERPHPGAQLRLTDADGHRLTAFAPNTTRGQLPDLELRHRRRARAEDRIRIAKDTGLSNLPLATSATPTDTGLTNDTAAPDQHRPSGTWKRAPTRGDTRATVIPGVHNQRPETLAPPPQPSTAAA